jgi:hypothetical protein
MVRTTVENAKALEKTFESYRCLLGNEPPINTNRCNVSAECHK